jgi:SAM-dependent methyltransferase
MTSAERWRAALESWAIPPDILANAPESPWGCPVELFASRADDAVMHLSPSNLRALEALPEGGAVLDVGCGGGAASLPLAGTAGRLTGVDTNQAMLRAFADRAAEAATPFETVEGQWPDVADGTPPADVAVCNHVIYNVPDLAPFVLRLTDHARRRIVVELMPSHPLSNDSPLWLRFHGVVRPTEPTVEDAIAVIRETLGVEPDREDWTAAPGGRFARSEDLVAWIRRRLCLPKDRDREIEEALGPSLERTQAGFGFGPRPVVTLWWDGSADP